MKSHEIRFFTAFQNCPTREKICPENFVSFFYVNFVNYYYLL